MIQLRPLIGAWRTDLTICRAADGLYFAYLGVPVIPEVSAQGTHIEHAQNLVVLSLCIHSQGPELDECHYLGQLHEAVQQGQYGMLVYSLANLVTIEALKLSQPTFPKQFWSKLQHAARGSKPLDVFYRLNTLNFRSLWYMSQCVVAVDEMSVDVYVQHATLRRHLGFIRKCPGSQLVERLRPYGWRGLGQLSNTTFPSFILPPTYARARQGIAKEVLPSPLASSVLRPGCSVCSPYGLHLLKPLHKFAETANAEQMHDPSALACTAKEGQTSLGLRAAHYKVPVTGVFTLDAFPSYSKAMLASSALVMIADTRTINNTGVNATAAKQQETLPNAAAMQSIARTINSKPYVSDGNTIDGPVDYFDEVFMLGTPSIVAILVACVVVALLVSHVIAAYVIVHCGGNCLPRGLVKAAKGYAGLSRRVLCCPLYIWSIILMALVLLVHCVKGLSARVVARKDPEVDFAPPLRQQQHQQGREQQQQQRRQGTRMSKKAAKGQPGKTVGSSSSSRGTDASDMDFAAAAGTSHYAERTPARARAAGLKGTWLQAVAWRQYILQQVQAVMASDLVLPVTTHALFPVNASIWVYACLSSSSVESYHYAIHCVSTSAFLWLMLPRKHWPVRAGALVLLTFVALVPKWGADVRMFNVLFLVPPAYISQAPTGLSAITCIVVLVAPYVVSISMFLPLWCIVKFTVGGMQPRTMAWTFVPARGELLQQLVAKCDRACRSAGCTVASWFVRYLLYWSSESGFYICGWVHGIAHCSLLSLLWIYTKHLAVFGIKPEPFVAVAMCLSAKWRWPNFLLGAFYGLLAYIRSSSETGECLLWLLLAFWHQPTSQVLVPTLVSILYMQPWLGLPGLVVWIWGSTVSIVVLDVLQGFHAALREAEEADREKLQEVNMQEGHGESAGSVGDSKGSSSSSSGGSSILQKNSSGGKVAARSNESAGRGNQGTKAVDSISSSAASRPHTTRDTRGGRTSADAEVESVATGAGAAAGRSPASSAVKGADSSSSSSSSRRSWWYYVKNRTSELLGLRRGTGESNNAPAPFAAPAAAAGNLINRRGLTSGGDVGRFDGGCGQHQGRGRGNRGGGLRADAKPGQGQRTGKGKSGAGRKGSSGGGETSVEEGAGGGGREQRGKGAAVRRPGVSAASQSAAAVGASAGVEGCCAAAAATAAVGRVQPQAAPRQAGAAGTSTACGALHAACGSAAEDATAGEHKMQSTSTSSSSRGGSRGSSQAEKAAGRGLTVTRSSVPAAPEKAGSGSAAPAGRVVEVVRSTRPVKSPVTKDVVQGAPSADTETDRLQARLDSQQHGQRRQQHGEGARCVSYAGPAVRPPPVLGSGGMDSSACQPADTSGPSPPAMATGVTPAPPSRSTPSTVGGGAVGRKVAPYTAAVAAAVASTSPPPAPSIVGVGSVGGIAHHTPVSGATSAGAAASSTSSRPSTLWGFLDQVQAEAQRWQQHAVVDNTGLLSTSAAVSLGGHGRGPGDGGGIPPVAGANAGTASSSNRRDGGGGGGVIKGNCVLCGSEPRGVMLLPCRHYVLCRGCSKMVEGESGVCPACQATVARHLIVHRS